VIYGLYTAIGLVALALIVVTLVSLFRNPRISGGEKAVWAVATIIFPFLGSLAYFTVRRDW
jgi:bacteriorhodopsin